MSGTPHCTTADAAQAHGRGDVEQETKEDTRRKDAKMGACAQLKGGLCGLFSGQRYNGRHAAVDAAMHTPQENAASAQAVHRQCSSTPSTAAAASAAHTARTQTDHVPNHRWAKKRRETAHLVPFVCGRRHGAKPGQKHS